MVHRVELEEKMKGLAEYSETSPFNVVEKRGGKIGVISAGGAMLIAKEVFPEDTSFLKLGFTNPLPMNLIREFSENVETLYVIEELDPFMETEIKAAGIDCTGKDVVPPMYELNPTLLREALTGEKVATREVDAKAIPRPPVLCPGCPHRGFF